MTPSVPVDIGSGPVVVLLHGVGVGPGSFARLVRLLSPDHRVVVLERPYGPGGEAPSVEAQADALAEVLVGVGAEGARLVGVSGGATVALALTMAHPELVGELVVHEPLVGPLAPTLSARFDRAAVRAAVSDAEAIAVIREVMGEVAWEALGDAGREVARAGAPRWRAEVPRFAAFAPRAEDLARLSSLPVLTTIGWQRDAARTEAAACLVRHAGAAVREVPDAGNAVHLDAPHAFAHVLRAWQPITTGERP